MGRNSQAVSARIAPESASAPPPHRPEPGLRSPSLVCTPAPSPLSVPPILTTWPTQYRWFGSGSGSDSCSGSGSKGRPSPAQGPRRPPGSHPSLPSPPPFAASPAPGCDCRYRCRGRRGGGKDREGCSLAGSSGRFRITPAPERRRDGVRRRSHPGFPKAFPCRRPRIRGRSAGVRGGERGPCALVNANVVCA